MKLLLDMNLPRDLARRLEQAGHECRHVGDIGLSQADDSEILECASAAGETVLTHDLDYGDLLAFSGESLPSVVIFRTRDVTVDTLSERFLAVLTHTEQVLGAGAIVVIRDRTIRVRRLPVRLD